MNSLNLPSRLLEYLDEARKPLPPVTDPDAPLQLDSLGLIRFVAFLEDELGVRIEDDELLADNFVTARAVRKLLASKSTGASTAQG